MAKQRELKWSQPVGNRIFKMIEKAKENGNHNIAEYSGGNMYQVTHLSLRKFSVDLGKKQCSCRKWDLTGIPCGHAMAAISWGGQDLFDYMHDWYKRDNYDATYEEYIAPMADHSLWPKIEQRPILPPAYHAQPGRKKKNRTREPDELRKGTEKLKKYNIHIKCSMCKQTGHNVKTCPQRPSTSAAPPRPRGRPPKVRSESSGLEPPTAQVATQTRQAAQAATPRRTRQSVTPRRTRQPVDPISSQTSLLSTRTSPRRATVPSQSQANPSVTNTQGNTSRDRPQPRERLNKKSKKK